MIAHFLLIANAIQQSAKNAGKQQVRNKNKRLIFKLKKVKK